MNPGQLGALVRLASAMPARLRRPLTPPVAEARLAEQLAARERNFLASARRLVFACPTSPYLRLLIWAGCTYPDLAAEVAGHGLEATLLRLRNAGVALSLDEFKGRTPIVRAGLTLETRDSDFDSPGLRRNGISGTTSGTRAAATRVRYDWDFLAEEAAHEVVLHRHHGVLDAPLALWYPVLPGVAGLHNLLLSLLGGHAPERWFSQVDPAATAPLSMPRLSLAGLRFGGRLGGQRVPAPEFAAATEPDPVLDWCVRARHRAGAAVVRTFASSAVRLAERARGRGLELNRVTVFAGGEPLTLERRRFLESAGLRVVSRYIATEPGLIAAGCRNARGADDMHLYRSRLAVVPGEGGSAAGSDGARSRLLFTTLTSTTGKVLLNTDLGDAAILSTRPCDCDFGRLGFNLRLEHVGSLERLTLEGMTVDTDEFEALVGELATARGGTPDAFQYRVDTDAAAGRQRLLLALSPSLGTIDSAEFLNALYRRMAAAGPGPALAARLWRDAGTIRLTRDEIRLSGGSKRPARLRAIAEPAAVGGREGR